MDVPAGNAAIAIAWTFSMAPFHYGRPSPLGAPSSLTISSSVSYSVSIHTVAPEVPEGAVVALRSTAGPVNLTSCTRSVPR